MIYLLYILLASIICMWVTNEKRPLYLIFYLLLFYCMVMKIEFKKEVVFASIAQDFIIGIIGALMIYFNNKNKKEE